MNRIKYLDLFAGIGGFRMGLTNAGDIFLPVGWCEIDRYAQKAYRALYETEGEYFCDDATKIEPAELPDIDLICAGFPCQPFSVSGRRLGFADTRGTLFHEIVRLAEAKRPSYLLLENVPGLRNKLNAESKYEIQLLIDQINSGICASDKLRNKLQTFAERLRQCPKSTKKYGYLPKGVKDLVDELVDELEKTEPITSLYETWYQLKCDVWRTYTEQFPPKKPLSQEDAFKPIKNALINEAVKLGAEFTEDEKAEKKKPENKADRKPAPVNKGLRVFNALVRFGYSLSQMFRDKFQSFDSEDDDIDKKLRQEIEAVKNGQNPTM